MACIAMNKQCKLSWVTVLPSFKDVTGRCYKSKIGFMGSMGQIKSWESCAKYIEIINFTLHQIFMRCNRQSWYFKTCQNFQMIAWKCVNIHNVSRSVWMYHTKRDKLQVNCKHKHNKCTRPMLIYIQKTSMLTQVRRVCTRENKKESRWGTLRYINRPQDICLCMFICITT